MIHCRCNWQLNTGTLELLPSCCHLFGGGSILDSQHDTANYVNMYMVLLCILCVHLCVHVHGCVLICKGGQHVWASNSYVPVISSSHNGIYIYNRCTAFAVTIKSCIYTSCQAWSYQLHPDPTGSSVTGTGHSDDLALEHVWTKGYGSMVRRGRGVACTSKVRSLVTPNLDRL